MPKNPLDAIHGTLNRMANPLGLRSLRKMMNPLAGISGISESLVRDLTGLSQSLVPLENSMSGLSESLVRDLTGLSQSLVPLENSMSGLSESLVRDLTGLSQSLAPMTTSMSRISESLAPMATSMSRISESLAPMTTSMSRISESLVRDLTGLSQSLVPVARSMSWLSEMVNPLVGMPKLGLPVDYFDSLTFTAKLSQAMATVMPLEMSSRARASLAALSKLGLPTDYFDTLTAENLLSSDDFSSWNETSADGEPCAMAAEELRKTKFPQLEAFTKHVLKLPRSFIPFVAWALFDDGHWGNRPENKGWRNASDPVRYLKRVIIRRHKREIMLSKYFEGNKKYQLLPDAEDVSLGQRGVAEALPEVWALDYSIVQVRMHLDDDCQRLFDARLKDGLARTVEGARKLGWTMRRLEAVWKRLNRMLAERNINLDAFWN